MEEEELPTDEKRELLAVGSWPEIGNQYSVSGGP